jgi:hypothetical protein
VRSKDSGGRVGRIARFAGYFLQMMIAMAVGMFILDPVWSALLPVVAERGGVYTIVMATDMAIGMAVWMRFRRHVWRRVFEMTAAMCVPFLLLLLPYWAGGISLGTLMIAGHVIMMPAMILVMVWQRAYYTRSHNMRRPTPRRSMPGYDNRLVRAGRTVTREVP